MKHCTDDIHFLVVIVQFYYFIHFILLPYLGGGGTLAGISSPDDRKLKCHD